MQQTKEIQNLKQKKKEESIPNDTITITTQTHNKQHTQQSITNKHKQKKIKNKF